MSASFEILGDCGQVRLSLRHGETVVVAAVEPAEAVRLAQQMAVVASRQMTDAERERLLTRELARLMFGMGGAGGRR